MNSLYSALLSTGLALLSHQPEVPWARACLSAESAADVLVWIRAVATHTDQGSAEQRALMRLPHVRESDVTYVADERICQGVLGEYNKYSGTRNATTGAASPPSRQVYVVQVGTVYAVTDPTKTYGGFLIWLTTDHLFRMLAHALG